ncbi:hypothetical protein Zmor_001978 [Zophobas morio]|uniref:Uncharacterized protein n=1 Tax=Zophobas morio TaxID=2755281 RepID=A0AA38J0A4_9CUCU|nr:hypothetical protein Zmor_001978 [Zophobas morio]
MKTQASTPMELGTKSIGRSAHTPKGERSRINPRSSYLILKERCNPASKGQKNSPRPKRLTTWRIQTRNQRMHCSKINTQASTPMELETKSIGRSAHTPKGECSCIDTGPTDLIRLG